MKAKVLNPKSELVDLRLSDGGVLQEITHLHSIGEVISVRAAKAHLSGLLEWVGQGHEIVITSNGKPKARLVPATAESLARPYRPSPSYVPPPWRGGPTSDELVREDRDSRGW